MTVAVHTEALAPEIIWWSPSAAILDHPEDFREDAAVWRDAGRNTMVGSYHGSQLHDSSSRVFVTVWKSKTHHNNFMSQESYADLVLPLLDAMAGPGQIQQAIIETPRHELTYALSAPVTQFIYITMRPLHDRSYELAPLLEKMQKSLRIIPGCVASCWGPSVEKDQMQIGIVGWLSLEDRNSAVDGPLRNTIQRIRELSHIEIRYAHLASDATF